MIPSPWHHFLRSLSSLIGGRPSRGRPFRKKASRRARLGIELLEDRLVPAAVRDLTGFTANTLPANDDDSTAAVALGFNAGFFGTTYNALYVNNNGYVTFDGPLEEWLPFELTGASIPIIAPFFADVDTRGPGSGVVTYGQDTVEDGRAAFGINWIGVGYFPESDDLLNSFQLVLIDRSAVAPGAFDIEFNYDQVQWDTTTVEGTYARARAGYAGGVELAGSGESGAFLDDNTTTGLIHSSYNSTVAGRYFFEVRGAGGNQAPVAADDSYSVDEDGTLDVVVAEGVLSNDSDPDEDVLTAALVTDVEHGTLLLQNDGSFTYTPAADWFGTDSFTYEVSDGQGGTATATVTLTVNPVNDAPVLVLEIPDQLATEDEPFSFTFAENSFADVDAGDTLTYTAALAGGEALPGWLSFDGPSRTFSGTPGNEDVGVLSITVTATDAAGAGATDSFELTVINTNDAPVVANPGAQSNTAGDHVNLAIFARDPDGDNLTFDIAGLPPGLTFDPGTGYISGSIETGAASGSPYTVTVTASDSMQSGSQTFTWYVGQPAPPWLGPPGDQVNAAGEEVALSLSAIGFSAAGLTYSALGLPEGLEIDPDTGLIAGTLTAAAARETPYEVTATVTDGTNSASQVFLWTVNFLGVEYPGTQFNDEDDTVSLELQAHGVSGLLIFEAAGLPDGLDIDPDTGVISGTIAGGAAGGSAYAVTVTVSDGTHSASQSFFWYVGVFSLDPPGDQFNAAADGVALQLWATAPSSATLTYSAVDLPGGLDIDPDTGLIFGIIADEAASAVPYQVTATVTDGTNTASQTFFWTVNFVGLVNPGTQLNEAGEAVSLELQAHGASGPLIFDAEGLPDGLDIDPDTGVIFGTIAATADADSPYTVTVSASDGTYQASQTFVWYVDPQPTLALDPPGNQFNAAGDGIELQLRSTAPSSAMLTYSVTGLPAGLGIDPGTGLISGTLTHAAASATPYELTATVSDSTNSVSQTFQWFVSFIRFDYPGTQLNLDGDVVSLPITAHDASGGQLTFSAAGLPDGLSINALTGLISGTIAAEANTSSPYTVTVAASDGTHSASQTFQWIVLAQPALLLAAPGDQVNAEGEEVELHLEATGTTSDPVTYSALGLPDGLDIDPDTGLISGTVTTAAVSDTPYLVTVTASDGTNTASQAFAWRVTAQGGPQMDVPGDTLATARPVQFDEDYGIAEVVDAIGNNSYGSLDVDLYRVELAEGNVLTVTVQAPDGAANDPDFGIMLRIFDASGNELVIAGDGVGLQPGETIDFEAPANGTYYIGVSYRGNSGYNPFLAGSGAAGLTGAYFLTLSFLPAADVPGGVGHHWVPVSVAMDDDILPHLSKKALSMQAGSWSGPTRPTHQFGTYGGLSHSEYNKLVKEELIKFMEDEGILRRGRGGALVNLRKMTEAEMEKFVENIRDGKNLSSKSVAKKIRDFNDEIKAQRAAFEKKFKVKPIATDTASVRDRGKRMVTTSSRYFVGVGLVGTVVSLMNTQKALGALSASPHFRGAYEDALSGNLGGVEYHLVGDPNRGDDIPLGNHLFGDMLRASDEPRIIYGSLGAYEVFEKKVREYVRKKQEQLNGLPND